MYITKLNVFFPKLRTLKYVFPEMTQQDARPRVVRGRARTKLSTHLKPGPLIEPLTAAPKVCEHSSSLFWAECY